MEELEEEGIAVLLQKYQREAESLGYRPVKENDRVFPCNVHYGKTPKLPKFLVMRTALDRGFTNKTNV